MSPLPSLLLSALLALAAADTDYCAICSGHTMCLYPKDAAAADCGKVVERGLTAKEQTEILNAHNKIRRDVKSGVYADQNLPAARKMPDLSWDPELAKVAQRWADQCVFYHDRCRYVSEFANVGVGQNLATETNDMESKDWTGAVSLWFHGELNNFKQTDLTFSDGLYKVGHLTQVIWATTTKVGCGFIGVEVDQYSSFINFTRRNYICNYGPRGNVPSQQIYQAA